LIQLHLAPAIGADAAKQAQQAFEAQLEEKLPAGG
jgi:hypothetical protein